MAGTTKETRQGQNRICLRAGFVSMEKAALWPLQATATFQRLMAQALTSVTKKYVNIVMCYVDDVVIATSILEDHIEQLDEVFACMKRAGLKCKPSKCEILKDSVTMKDAYPIPRIDESLSKLADANYFTTLDLGSFFWQVPLRKQDRDKTGFACALGLFQWKRLPFGLCKRQPPSND